MAVCETQLWELVRSIEPTQTQKDGAVRSHNYLRSLLKTGNMASRIVTDYLSGSYARDTAIRPLDDVDIIFVINPTYWNASFIPTWAPSYPEPDKVLQSFASAIRYRYPVSTVFGQRRSVCLQLNHLYIDVVPAIQNQSDPALIHIPDSNAQRWIQTSPKRHSDNATAVNKFQNSRFKPLVKLLKCWNGNLPSTAKFKSFTIETMAVRLFKTVQYNSLQQGLSFFFDFIAYASGSQPKLAWQHDCGVSLRWLNCSVPDAAETGSNTAANVDEDTRKRFVENAIRSRDKVFESINTLSVETACKRISEALRL